MRITSRTRAIAAVLTAVGALALTGCSGISASRSGALTDSTSSPVPVHTHTGANSDLGGAGAGGAGSLTVALSKPVAVSGHVNTTVSCVIGRHYTATAGPVSIDGTSLSIEIVVAGYSAPGSYSAVVTASVTPTGSAATDVAGLPGIPVTITSTGGSVNLSATATEGRVIAGSIIWACS